LKRPRSLGKLGTAVKFLLRGEDSHPLIDIFRTLVTKPGKKVRITLDISQSLVKEIDAIREAIGVDHGALIKVWLYDRVRQEKSTGDR
jgi:hypothetical protein